MVQSHHLTIKENHESLQPVQQVSGARLEHETSKARIRCANKSIGTLGRIGYYFYVRFNTFPTE